MHVQRRAGSFHLVSCTFGSLGRLFATKHEAMSMESATPEAAPIPPDTIQPPTVVEDDRMCVRCGYNLRTLSLDANCPECAAPVRNSFLSDKLVFSHPTWVRSLARGTGIGCVGVLLFVLLMLLIFNDTFRSSPSAYTYLSVLYNLPVILVSIGAFIFTKAETFRKAATSDPKSRTFARILVIIWLSLMFGPMVLIWGLQSFLLLPSGGFLLVTLQIARISNAFVTILLCPAMLLYARNIARRSSSPRLEGWARVLFYLQMVLTALVLIGAFVIFVPPLRSVFVGIPDGFAAVFGCYGVMTMLLTFIFAARLYFALKTDHINASRLWKMMDQQTNTAVQPTSPDHPA